MKVRLINPDYLLYPFPPIGMAYLAGYVRKHSPDVDIKIFDQMPEKKILSRIEKEKPEVIGFSSTSPHHWKVKKLATKVREISKGILVLGGIHVTNYPPTIKESPFDIGVLGEGEITFNKLIRSIESSGGLNAEELKEVPGFVFEFKGEIVNTGNSVRVENLDEIPLPARDLLNMRYYSLPSLSNKRTFESTGLIFTSRGCPYHCTFCSSTKFWGNCVKFFSAKRVVEEIEVLYKVYNYKIIQIYDDLFAINKDRLREIISLLEEKELLGKIRFNCFGRGNCFDEEIVRLLKKLNVKEIDFGIETGSERMLKKLKDKITLQDDINAINLCRKYGIRPLGAFMIGMPGETEKDFELTYKFIKKYVPESFVVAPMSAFPGTPIWDYAVDNNLVKEDIYEKEGRRFLEFDENCLLSKDVSRDTFKEYYFKIQDIKPKKMINVEKFLTFRLRHLQGMINPLYLKKVYNLGVRKVRQG